MIDLLKTVARRSLTEAEAASAMRTIMRGEATTAQIAGFALAVTVRGASVDDLAGMARAAQEFATPVPLGGDVLDTCGTGGDGLNTFNVSTASAIVAAACGVRVAKHGNRSASSACGSADVLEELGVRIDLGPREAADCLAATGITFLYAPGSTRRSGTPPRRAASWAPEPSSTCSARSATPPGRGCAPSGCPAPTWSSRWPRCWPGSAPGARWSSTARTAWTNSAPEPPPASSSCCPTAPVRRTASTRQGSACARTPPPTW